MKFTSEDLMKTMGLSVGDRVKVKLGFESTFFSDSKNYVVEIFKDTTGIIMIKNDKNQSIFLVSLVGHDYEILPRPKRVGDLKCSDYVEDCSKCPVRVLCGDYSNEQDTFYEMLQGFVDLSGDFFDQEIHDLLKARLDKEVE